MSKKEKRHKKLSAKFLGFGFVFVWWCGFFFSEYCVQRYSFSENEKSFEMPQYMCTQLLYMFNFNKNLHFKIWH